MNKEKAIRILRGDVLGTNEQTHEAVLMAIKALKAEQKHGKWLEPTREGCLTYDKAAYAECSECGKKEYLGWDKNYCPNCGAKMFAKDIDVPNKEKSESCGT